MCTFVERNVKSPISKRYSFNITPQLALNN